jgi:hypothetical protein
MYRQCQSGNGVREPAGSDAADARTPLPEITYVLDAPVGWQVLGTLLAVALVARSVSLVWRAVFSTRPRNLALG